MQVVVIGGSDAGISAALRIRELKPEVNVKVVLADNFPNYSICGIPFYLSGEVEDWHSLAHRTQAEITATGIELIPNHTAEVIDPKAHQVQLRSLDGETTSLRYDQLIIATGATSVWPAFIPTGTPGVFPLHTMSDSFAIQEYLTNYKPHRAVIVGSGYIGLEMADALTQLGISVTLVGRARSVLKTLDQSLGRQVKAELERCGVVVHADTSVEHIARDGDRLRVAASHGLQLQTDMVLVVTGVEPATRLAQTANLVTGISGAIAVNNRMQTSVGDIWAAGDCVETWHQLLVRPTYMPLGTTAHKQGRVAGENAIGGDARFAGSPGTQVVKVFEQAFARTGLNDDEANTAGFNALTVETQAWDHKIYYPGARQLTIRITGDRSSGRLLGAQIGGDYRAEVAKRIDIFATAIAAEMSVARLNQLDLSYTPPLGSPWDAVQLAAQAWLNATRE